MTRVSVKEVYKALIYEGATGDVAQHFCVIVARETGMTWDTQAHNYDPPRDDSWGLYQLNRLAHPDITVACATDLQCSSQKAMEMYRRNGWRDWAGDESKFPEYAAYVESELSGGALQPPLGQTGDPYVTPNAVPADEQGDGIGQGIHDFMLAVTVELVSLTLIAIGLWGIANGNESAGAAVRSGTRKAVGIGKLLTGVKFGTPAPRRTRSRIAQLEGRGAAGELAQ